MTFQRINPEDIELVTLTTNPPKYFHSASTYGVVSGTLHVFPRRSPSEKEVHPLSNISGSFHDLDLDVIRQQIILSTTTNKKSLLETYMKNVNQQGQSLRKQQTIEILRFQPTAKFSSNSLRKSVVLKQLMPFYRHVQPESHFSFTNYNSLNFMSGSGLPNDTALVYADSSGKYALTGAFSFDFWINPRYTSDFEGASFTAGTIFHRSSSYALSLLTGSSKDINGLPDSFRLLLQLSSSSETNPSNVPITSVPVGLNFFSDNNSLKKNTWNHVSIRWGTTQYNNGSGSFVINGTNAGNFVIPSSSFSNNFPTNVLIVGNYFAGGSVEEFFGNKVAQRDGLEELVISSNEAPPGYSLNNPLNAEIHDLKIYGRYLDNDEIEYLETRGPTSGSNLLHKDLLFYLPPFYTQESPERKYVDTHGGVIITPFVERDGTTESPINVDVSFGGYGHYINLENFTRDFATSTYARLFNLTASVIPTTSPVPSSFNDFLYSSGSNLKRNMMILPCDNGNFLPDFTFMIPGDSDINAAKRTTFTSYTTQSYPSPFKVKSSQFVNDLGTITPGYVTLNNLIPETLFQSNALSEDTGSLGISLNGTSPESLGSLPSTHGRYTVFQRTGDNSSNQITFFDISNLYYGKEIEPGTLTLRDTSFSGSYGKFGITIKDDGRGNLYRADHSGSLPTWSSLGNIFYNEGILLLKHPSLYFFGKDQFDISFKGKQNTHIVTYNLFKHALTNLSSSNPNYLPVSASEYANDYDKRFVYISNVLLHDGDLNVVAKTQLAQPILARSSEKYLFKIKLDW